MSTAIEWTDETWNPVHGCTRVSEGCGLLRPGDTSSGGCYAERLAPKTYGTDVGFKVTLAPHLLDKPLRWRKPRRIFTVSMGDLFHDDVPDDYIARVFAVMGHAKRHTFQVLTKRPGRMASLLNSAEFRRSVARVAWHGQDFLGPAPDLPLPNVWLGTSVETQKWADVRVPKLLETPAAVRFLSCEPLLGPVDLMEWLDPLDPDADCERCGQEWWARSDGHPILDEENDDTGEWCPGPMRRHSGVNWIIVGGESGPRHRLMQSEWVKSLFGQAQAGRVAFFFKQWGGRTPKAGGRELYGREWLEFPEVAVNV